ncbi:MAG: porin family protein [Planctomycetaceae bacterium]|nr:porin family protein [Planctomycetaceae bacterium]
MKRMKITLLLVAPAVMFLMIVANAQAQECNWIDEFECCDSGCADGCCDCDYDWSGFYAGIHTGYSSLSPNSSQFNLIQPNSSGSQIGVHLGYNRQHCRWVYGLETDFTLTELDRQVPCFNPAFDCLAASDWNASLRGRLGMTFDRLLVYGTAGISFADYHGFTRFIATGTEFTDSTVMTAPTVGAGVEYALTDRLRMRAEYRYANYDDFTLGYDIPYTVDPETHTINVGMTVSF